MRPERSPAVVPVRFQVVVARARAREPVHPGPALHRGLRLRCLPVRRSPTRRVWFPLRPRVSRVPRSLTRRVWSHRLPERFPARRLLMQVDLCRHRQVRFRVVGCLVVW
jgi:hypothetical protein